MSSLLSWDDLESDDNPILAKAAANIKTLDVESANKFFEEQSNAFATQREISAIGATVIPQTIVAGQMDVNVLSVSGEILGTPMQRAAAAVVGFKERMEYGERVLAKDKRLLNATTDLNQLIPFKYPWAWSMYLDGANNNWMPTECEGYINDEKNLDTLPPEIIKLITSFVLSYQYSTYVYTAPMLVNTYRLSTNPEVRQYQLRQVFEEQVHHHSVRHVMEVFNLDSVNYKAFKHFECVYQDRNTNLNKHIGVLRDMSMTTDTPEQLQKFIVAVAAVYGGMRSLYHLVPMYQLVKYNRDTGRLTGLSDNIKKLLANFSRQLDFGVRYINDIVTENPDAMTDDVAKSITKMMKELDEANGDLLPATIDGNADTLREGMYLSKYFTNQFLNQIGIPTTPQPIKQEYFWFIELIDGLKGQHDNAQVGLGGNLSW